ncbi:MAG: dihydroorotase [Paracoccaceae bacterium]
MTRNHVQEYAVTSVDTLTIRRPDDWHLHLRDGDMLRAVLPFTANVFGRAIIMPNLTLPVARAADAAAYRDRIMAALPAGADFTPLMTAYLTDGTDPEDLAQGHADGIFTAAKLYPAGATTNSDNGVTDLAKIRDVLAAMERIGMPLLVHGEVTDPAVDIFDREKVFIERVLKPALEEFSALKVVFEHITTAEGVAFVRGAGANVAATITPHHLVINRNALFAGGMRPHMFCLPVAKRERHRLALRDAATSGEAAFFLGTDSAPHPVSAKETDCGCAGIFNAPSALEVYAQVFDDEGALEKLEAFASLNGPAFYGLPVNEGTVTLERGERAADALLTVGDEEVLAFETGVTVGWRIAG